MIRKIAIVFVALCFIPTVSMAQSRFSGSLELKSANWWSSYFLGLPTQIINYMLVGDDFDKDDYYTPALGSGFSFRSVKYVNNGQKMETYGPNHYPVFKKDNFLYNTKRTYGFRAQDLFRDFEYAARFTYQPEFIPVGFYGRIGYAFEKFKLRYPGEEHYTKYNISTLRPGLGIRISPLENLMDEWGAAPIIELGGIYNYHIGYKGGVDDDKDELNDGTTTQIGIGMKKARQSIVLSVEYDNFNLFNKDFEFEGTKPYANMKSTRWNMNLSFYMDF